MMDKQVQFFGKTESGIFCQSLFGSSGALTKTAGAASFDGWDTADEIRRYIQTITPEDRKNYCYVLVNALGAGEYFGSNINADYFPWDALCHEGDDYGYKTFLNAHAYQHHINKDPSRAFGIPVVSALNKRMKRVELIIRLDRAKAKLEGADGIITRIDNGEFPDVSMGCKVPYDVCSICGNHSKTRADYCQHMNPPEDKRGVWGPNKILEDGRRIYVVNTLPRFFDISFVFIGADKTAKVMAKLASRGPMVCLGEICAVPRTSSEVAELVGSAAPEAGSSTPTLSKTASASCECDCGGSCGGSDKLASAFSVKTSSHKKLSEIIKNVPTGTFAMKKLPELEASEPKLTKGELTEMSSVPLADSLGIAARMGIVIRPAEFQRMVLCRMGEHSLADQFDRHNYVFSPSSEFDESIDINCSGELAKSLDPVLATLTSYVRERSAFGAPFAIRLILRSNGRKISLPTPKPLKHSLLDKISAAYNGYRRDVMMKLSQAVGAVQSDPRLMEAVLGQNLANMFLKTSSVPLVSVDTVSYMMGAHLVDRGLLSNTAVAEAIADNNEWLSDIGDHS
jgi:hypothetical protein